MKKGLKVFPLLMMLPMMMANSPAPKPVTRDYQDVDIYVNYVGVDENIKGKNNVCYEVEIKNAGKGYIAPFTYAYFKSSDGGATLNLEQTNQIFTNQTIAPGKAEKYHTYVPQSFDFAKRYDVTFQAYTYPMEDVDFSGAVIKEDYKKSNQYVLKVDNDKVSSVNTALFIDVTYDGVDMCFYMFFNANNRTFTTNEKLDLDKLKINKITAYEERASTTYNSAWGTFLWVLLILFFAIILSAILTPIIITSVRRSRR